MVSKVSIEVRGFDISAVSFKSRSYAVQSTEFTTVLDALLSIKETIDAKVSFRYSCRMGICGSCAMVINGKPRLACETKISELKREGKTLVVEPMMGRPLLKDLVTDFDDFFEKHRSVTPWPIRANDSDRFDDKKALPQNDYERDSFLPFAECIKCGLCLDACPVANTNKEFTGPQALAQAYRYYADSKDQGARKRLEYLDSMENVWGCEFAGACSVVCPKNVDPALAIQLLKAEIAKYRLTGKVPK